MDDGCGEVTKKYIQILNFSWFSVEIVELKITVLLFL